MKNKEKSESSFRDKAIAFKNRHPKFRVYLDKIDEILEKVFVFYWMTVVLVIALPVIVVYYRLPDPIRNEVTGLFGGTLSLIVIPLAINHLNKKVENDFKLYELNKSLYNDLFSCFIPLLKTENVEFEKSRMQLEQVIYKNYSVMCLSFSPSLIRDIINVYRESNDKKNIDNIRYYTYKCLYRIRRQAGLKKYGHLDDGTIKK